MAMTVDESQRPYTHPLYDYLLRVPGLDVAVSAIDQLLTWGATNSQWIFPMATSCCGIEFMAAAASRVDMDRMGAIIRGTPRQCDVMVVAGTITVKMAPRVKRLWDQMPEPKWCVAMGSCAISGDFYRDIYSVIPGIDTAVPVDVYIPGCPPNPEQVMAGMIRLQEKVRLKREGKEVPRDLRPETAERTIMPEIGRYEDRMRKNAFDPINIAQLESAKQLVVKGIKLPDGVVMPKIEPKVEKPAPVKHVAPAAAPAAAAPAAAKPAAPAVAAPAASAAAPVTDAAPKADAAPAPSPEEKKS